MLPQLLTASGNPSGGYQIQRSVRLRSSASAYFNRTPASAGNLSTWTWSAWVKRGTLSSGYQTLLMGGTTADNNTLAISFTPSDTLQIQGYSTTYFTSNQVFRDPSAWYHIVVGLDSTQATQANRCKVYVNGALITGSTNVVPLNGAWNLNNNVLQTIGYQSAVWGFTYFDGYMTEMNFVNAQQLTASSFGETDTITGVWKPKKYLGTYGTNGFYLNFSDNSAATAAAIGKDYSGNGNNWTPNNISLTAGATYDSMIDTPTPYADGGNGRGNYAVLNPLDKAGSGTLTNGNFDYSTTVGTFDPIRATTGVSSGKWYWEVTCTAQSGSSANTFLIGIASITSNIFASGFYLGFDAASYSYYGTNGQKYNNNSGVSYGASYTTNDVIGVALDLDAGTLVFYKNNTSQGTAYSGLSGTFVPAYSDGATAGATSVTANFGQRPFSYTPPSGYKALNTLNLPDPTIKRGADYFDIVTRAGTGASVAINNYRFSPDLVWLKSRTNAYFHKLVDTTRGANKVLSSNSTNAEITETQGLMSFDSNGYTLGTSSDSTVNNAGAGQTYVDWAWKKGATPGFDIQPISFTAGGTQTVSHSLGVVPSMIIVKSRSNGTQNWVVYHGSMGNTGFLALNLTNAFAANASAWNNTSPTSSVFTLGSGFTTTNYGANGIAYLFSEVAGFSKFGSYTGNGSSDGPFVFCGFRPRFVLVKCSSAAGDNWVVIDSSRNEYNVSNNLLLPSSSSAELSGSTTNPADFLSNGFKLRGTGTSTNSSGATYIFAAFAENPFKYSLAR